MHSKGMHLGLRGTRIFVRFLRVWAVVWQKAHIHAIGTNNMRADKGFTWRRRQVECTRLQVWVRDRTTTSVVVVFTRRTCGPRCSIGYSSRALETSSHEAQKKVEIAGIQAQMFVLTLRKCSSFSHFLFLRHRFICWPGPLPKR